MDCYLWGRTCPLDSIRGIRILTIIPSQNDDHYPCQEGRRREEHRVFAFARSGQKSWQNIERSKQTISALPVQHPFEIKYDLIERHRAAAWPGWLEAAERSPYAPFARSLRRDQDAIAAALQLPWSNGMVEGQIHRLKLIKRQMYGRSGFDLLRLRILHSI